MIKLNEQSKDFKELEKQWYKEIDTLTTQSKYNNFVKKLVSGYEHDFGTSLRAIACIVNATIRFYGGGLTNFQANYLMWKILETSFGIKDKVGLQLLKYEDLLFPQLIYHFEHEITKMQHDTLIDLAKEYLVKSPNACDDVRKHWKKIASGWLPNCVGVIDESEDNA